MANKTIPMKRLRSVLRLHAEHHSKQAIASSLRLSRNTVRKYIAAFRKLQLTWEDIQTMDDATLALAFSTAGIPSAEEDERLQQLRAFFPYMSKELKKQGVTRRILWEEYIQLHPDGYRISQFKEYYGRWNRRVNPVMHIEHKAGDMMQIDFAGKKLQVTDRDTGEVTDKDVFVAVLPASQYTYMEATESQANEDLIPAAENAMYYFGGVARAMKPDNMRSAVTKANWFEPQLNETFEDFLHHYNTTAVPTRPRKPRDKASVEGAVRIVYTSVYAQLRNQVFFSLEELNQAIRRALDVLNDKKLTGRPYSRRELFNEIEKAELGPLPASRFELREYTWATVLQNGHVCLKADKHYYSVPYRFIRRKVKLSYDSKGVEIFCDHQCIAKHPRIKRPYNYTTKEDHLASTHKFMTRWNPQYFIDWASRIDPKVQELIEQVLEHKKHPEQAYRSCMGILTFDKKVERQRLVGACQRALEFGVYTYMAVKSILERGLDKGAGQKTEDRPMPDHTNIRGKTYYQ
jgi:transposase